MILTKRRSSPTTARTIPLFELGRGRRLKSAKPAARNRDAPYRGARNHSARTITALNYHRAENQVPRKVLIPSGDPARTARSPIRPGVHHALTGPAPSRGG